VIGLDFLTTHLLASLVQPSHYYHRYPFTLQVVDYSYVNARWSCDDEVIGLPTTGLYRASWGFDYYVRDITLAAHRPTDEAALKTGVELAPHFRQRVLSPTLSPDASHGQLEGAAQPPTKDTAFLEEVAPPVPQPISFRVDKSPEALKRPPDAG
jgi:hypothetical protein